VTVVQKIRDECTGEYLRSVIRSVAERSASRVSILPGFRHRVSRGTEMVQRIEHFQKMPHAANETIAAHTNTVWNSRRWAASGIWSSAGRFAFAPLIRSMYSWTISNPPCSANQRRSSPSVSGF
jgi:hypothetical protein